MKPVLGWRTSQLLRAYFRGPDHPAKLRLWEWMRRLTGHPLFLVRYMKDGWIHVDERDRIGRELFIEGFYEPEVWETLAAFADSNEIVWDIGAHIGSFALRPMSDPRVQEVHAFEPNPRQLEILSSNVSMNSGRCVVHPFALSDRQETRPLYQGPPHNTGLSSLAVAVSEEADVVNCRTVDSLVFEEKIPPPSLLKVDAEDWELHVFQGAERTLSEFPPKAIVFEGIDEESGLPAGEAASFLKKKGYAIRHIERRSNRREYRENYLAARP